MKQVLQETDQFFNEFMGPVSKKLLFVMFGVFLLSFFIQVFGNQTIGAIFSRLFVLNPEQAILQANIWQFVTYGFTHFSFFHFLMNGLGLFFFGRLIESQMGGSRYAWFVFLNIIFAGFAHIIFSYLFGKPATGLIGFSGAVFAIIIAAAVWFPRMRVLFMFVVPVPLRVLAIIFVIITFLGLFEEARGSNISHTAHLSGIIWGFLMVKNPRILDFFENLYIPFITRRRPKMVKRRTSMGHPGRHSDPDDLYDDPHWKLDQ